MQTVDNLGLKNFKRHPYVVRQVLLEALRRFLTNRRLVELTLPILSPNAVLEPTIYQFETEWGLGNGQKKQKLFLATSPEQNFKKLMAKFDLGNCFAIGHSFRNLESSGAEHQPEFLMLEWYRQNSNCLLLMKETQRLIRFAQHRLDHERGLKVQDTIKYQGQSLDLSKPWPTLSLVDLFAKYTKIELIKALKRPQLLLEWAKDNGYKIEQSTTIEQIFNQIMLNEIEPHFSKNPFFLVDFPAFLSPMAKAQIDQPELAQRFELYIGKIEIANACVEQDNKEVLDQVFQTEKNQRLAQGDDCLIDEEFLEAVGINSTKALAGVGLGVDRLAMILSDSQDISEVTQANFS